MTSVPAVRRLLEEEAESLNLELLDNYGQSVVDAALLSLGNQKSASDAWEVPTEKKHNANMDHW